MTLTVYVRVCVSCDIGMNSNFFPKSSLLQFVSVTETQCAFCAVGTDHLNVTCMNMISLLIKNTYKKRIL
jgi:hypothetical protein